MQHGTEDWGGRRMAVGPVAVLFGVLAVFVLVHMGTAHDLVIADVSTAGSHERADALSYGDDLDQLASTPTGVASNALAHADPHHGGRPPGDGHHDVLVGCLVALTGLAGGLMLLRPRHLATLAAACRTTASRSLAVVRSRALGTLRAPSLASLCVLRT